MERISQNHALNTICNTFFTNAHTATRTGNVLVKFLIKRLPDIGGINNLTFKKYYF